MRFSIVIPVFNGENFIRRCYESVIKQSFEDWQIVFVNDGSYDKSLSILNELAYSNPKIKVITQRNMGLASARETGLTHADGQYIVFLDVDDFLLPEALRIFNNGFQNENIDVVVSGFVLSENGKVLKEISYRQHSITGKEYLRDLCKNNIRWQAWAKAYKKDILTKVDTPPEKTTGEDIALSLQVAAQANHILVDSNTVYNYVQQPQSITHLKGEKLAKDSFFCIKFATDRILKKFNPDDIKTSIDSLYLLILSAVLKNVLSTDNTYLRSILNEHFNRKAILNIPKNKALNILLYKILKFNIFSLHHKNK